MAVKDKVMITLAIISLGFIGFIAIKNQPAEGAVYTGNFYMTDETVDIGTQAGSSWEVFNTRSKVMCPGLDNIEPTGTKVITSGVTSKANAYNFNYMPFTKEAMNLNVSALNNKNFKQAGISSSTSKGIITEFISSASPNIGTGYYEIIAPFSYTYLNQNVDTENPNSIIIMNRSRSCRMVVESAANWFCAGVYGTSTVYGTGISDNCDWSMHSTHHQSVLGIRSDKKSDGSAGELIGYGDESTTISFEIIRNGSWTPCSLDEIIRSV